MNIKISCPICESQKIEFQNSYTYNNKIFKVMIRPFFVTYILHILCHWKVHGIITITHFTINK